MPYFCIGCGEEEKFEGFRDYAEYGTEKIFFNSEGEIQDYGDKDTNDGDIGDWHDLVCSECGQNVSDLDEEDIIDIKKQNGWDLSEAEVEIFKEMEKAKEIDWKERIQNRTRGKKNVRI
jgi:hypothetical protein